MGNAGRMRRSLAQSDLRGHELTTGDPQSQDHSVGAQRATWSTVNLTGGGAVGTERIFDVTHELGVVPTTCDLAEWENAATPGTHLTARPYKKHLWTHSSLKMAVYLVAGSFDATQAKFKVSA